MWDIAKYLVSGRILWVFNYHVHVSTDPVFLCIDDVFKQFHGSIQVVPWLQ